MKKIKFFRGMILMTLLVAVLAGCGGGGPSGPPDGPTPNTICFTMPGFYYDPSNATCSIPGNKTVKFYTLNNTSEPINADSTVFTGTTATGGGTLRFTLPNSLKDQSRYIFAVVILKGDFDLQGKTQAEIVTAMSTDKLILFGKVQDAVPTGNTQSVTLTNGNSIGNFAFKGASGIDGSTTVSTINFTMPSSYYTSTNYDATAAIPGGKTVKFYTMTNTSEPINADSTVYTSTTTTGGSTLQFTLPDSLVGITKYIFAVVILSGDFDLQGKTVSQLQAAVTNGQVLFGKAASLSNPGSAQPVTLTDGDTIDNFAFLGTSNVIHFTVPDSYYTGADYTAPVPMPSDRTVKFYTMTEAVYNNLVGNPNATINADYIFSGTTGDSDHRDLEFTLPGSLKNQQRYIFAVVILTGSFNLQGKTLSQLMTAITNGEVVFGKATDGVPSGDTLLVTLTGGGTISDFTFSTYISH